MKPAIGRNSGYLPTQQMTRPNYSLPGRQAALVLNDWRHFCFALREIAAGANGRALPASKRSNAHRRYWRSVAEAFVAIAARICPNDVRLTLEQAIPGGMSLEDYSLMREVIAAIRESLPDADQSQPGAVFQHVLGARCVTVRRMVFYEQCLLMSSLSPLRLVVAGFPS
jgi:hypothetical protein